MWERQISSPQWARIRVRPGAICGLSLVFVGFRLAPRVFLWFLRFFSLHKNEHSKFYEQSTRRILLDTTGDSCGTEPSRLVL